MVLNHKRPITVITEQPAHLGYRNEHKTFTTLNRANGKMEQHHRTQRTPIFGTVQNVNFT